MYLLFFYVPKSHVNQVTQSLFDLGLGKFEHYDSCCFTTEGTGQFRPLEGNNAFIGKTNEIEKVEECKVEMICPESLLEQAKAKLINSHPYETPAYGFISIVI